MSLRHDAMATDFRIVADHDDDRYARQAMAAAFELLDGLDQHLSRFVDHSDVTRLNRAPAGSWVVVDVATHDCMQLAQEIDRQTQGAFNVVYQSVPRCRSFDALSCHRQVPSVRRNRTTVQIDLGGIGKGFALDQMAALLCQWDLTRVALWASASTVLTLDPPRDHQAGWPVTLGRGEQSIQVMVKRQALSGSGTAVKGTHIVDPNTGLPAKRRRQVWARARCAARADALSTAFFVMSEKAIREFCRRHSDDVCWLESVEGRPQRVPATSVVSTR